MNGRPASEQPAMRNVQKATGSSLRNPPIRKMLCSSCERIDDHAGAKKQEGLEERMGHEVEHGRLPCADAKREKHVTDLADGGVGEHALDVVLRKRAESGEQQRGRTHDRDGELRRWRQRKQDVRARDQINACGNHRGRVEESAGRSRAGHRIRQPNLQRKLRRFSHRTT